MNKLNNAVIVDTSSSSHAQLCPVPINAVVLHDMFWAPRLQTNREVTLPSQYQQCEDTGRIDNFRRAAGTKDVPFQGMYFNDSDVYKWLEAVAWTLSSHADDRLSQMMQTVADAVAAAQQPDGYLNTYYMFEHLEDRLSNLADGHELYCAGHFIQGAIAHYRSTGSTQLLDVARRLADYICNVFAPDNMVLTDGHPEIEMALVELARATGEDKYLRQAQFLTDVRGYGRLGGSSIMQDHVPFRELREVIGHAVRAMYLSAGATDLYTETGEAELLNALSHQWDNMTQRRMYISGGLGARYEGEAFGKDYELPNPRAYAETCAAIASVMWNWRMLQLQGEARFADVMEQALYNGVLSSLSLDGQSYFYQNPLADDGTHRRQPWFGCACCPPNIARLLASLPGYFYSVSDEAVSVHLYAEGKAQLTLTNNHQVELTQCTQYPWDGDISIEIVGEGEWKLRLRIPGWCEIDAQIWVNDELLTEPLQPGSYACIHRQWQNGDMVRLHLPMPVRVVEAHPHVVENSGQVALMRGPLLYCVEAVDNPHAEVRNIVLPAAPEYSTQWQPELLGGVVTLHTVAANQTPEAEWANRLYRTAQPGKNGHQSTPVQLTAIPYYAWANREPGAMCVWLRTA